MIFEQRGNGAALRGGRSAASLRMLVYSHHLGLHYLTSVQQLSEQRKQQEHEAAGELEPLTTLS